MPSVGGQLWGPPLKDAGIYTGSHRVWAVSGEEGLIEEVVRRARHVELAVLEVPPEVNSCFQTVLPMGDRHHIRVGIDVFVRGLRVPGVGAESHTTVIEAKIGNPGGRRTDITGDIKHIAGAKFVQHRRTETVNVAQLTVGELLQHGVAETGSAPVAVAYGIGKTETVGKPVPIELAEEAILLPEVVVDSD